MNQLGSRCRFANECPIFRGEVKVNQTPLSIHRNVFCNRGMKGWKNCERFNELDKKIFNHTKSKMATKKMIKIQTVKSKHERDILLLLKEKDECIYGEIIKELHISTARGQKAIHALIKKGFITHKENSSRLKLNIEIEL